MSSTLTDPLDSQNGSKSSFEGAFMMEIEDDVLTTQEAQDEDTWIARPYQDEPIANAEWVENYNERRRRLEETLQMLRSRQEGRVTVESW